MTDFFDRLVMKVLGRGVVLEPVILTPFEEGGDLVDIPPPSASPAESALPPREVEVRTSGSPGSNGVRRHFLGDNPPAPPPFRERGRDTDAGGGRKDEAQRAEAQKNGRRNNKETRTASSHGDGAPSTGQAGKRSHGDEGFSSTVFPPIDAPSADHVPGDGGAMADDAPSPLDRPPGGVLKGARRNRSDLGGAVEPPLSVEEKTMATRHEAVGDSVRFPDRGGGSSDGGGAGGVDGPVGRAKPQRDGASLAPAARPTPVGVPGKSGGLSPSPSDGGRRFSAGDGNKNPLGDGPGASPQAASPSFLPVPSSVSPSIPSHDRTGRGPLFPQLRDGEEHGLAKSSPQPRAVVQTRVGARRGEFGTASPSTPTPTPTPAAGEAAIPLSSVRAGRTTQGQTRGTARGEGDERARSEVEIHIDRIDVRENPVKPGTARAMPTPGPSLTVDAYIARRQGCLSSGGEHE